MDSNLICMFMKYIELNLMSSSTGFVKLTM